MPARSTPAELYRREIAVTGLAARPPAGTWKRPSRSFAELDLPEPLVLPLDRFDEGLAAYRDREALKVVFRP